MSYTISPATTSSYEAFKELLGTIPERDPKTFFAFSEEVLEEIFEKPDTWCVLVYKEASKEASPIAGGFIWRPADDDSDVVKEEHEGGDIGFKPGEYLQLDNTVVHPDFRGRNMQANIIMKLIESIHMPAVATVAPSNKASLNNLEKCGFKIQKTVKRHDDYERHVMLFSPKE